MRSDVVRAALARFPDLDRRLERTLAQLAGRLVALEWPPEGSGVNTASVEERRRRRDRLEEAMIRVDDVRHQARNLSRQPAILGGGRASR